MKYKVKITDNTTGESREHDMGSLQWEDHTHFWWTEGNFGCDCNRGIEFDRAGDEEKDWGDDVEGPDPYPCGSTRYTVHHATLEDGTVIKIDDD